MRITFCDRCGKVTENGINLLVKTSIDNPDRVEFYGGFFKPLFLCNDCLIDFENFRINHDNFNKNLCREGKE